MFRLMTKKSQLDFKIPESAMIFIRTNEYEILWGRYRILVKKVSSGSAATLYAVNFQILWII